jgi:hypothetical protein
MEVVAGRRGGQISAKGQLSCRVSPPVEQIPQHGRTGRLADQRSNPDEIFFHSSFQIELFVYQSKHICLLPANQLCL